ncbi:unnamed protein product, partial [Discosporangium mesarthrocarpum]
MQHEGLAAFPGARQPAKREIGKPSTPPLAQGSMRPPATCHGMQRVSSGEAHSPPSCCSSSWRRGCTISAKCGRCTGSQVTACINCVRLPAVWGLRMSAKPLHTSGVTADSTAGADLATPFHLEGVRQDLIPCCKNVMLRQPTLHFVQAADQIFSLSV